MPPDREQFSLTAVPVPTLIRLLKQNGSVHISQATIELDRQNGAPIPEDGPVDVVAYAAWLARRATHGA
ncbi:MAG: hypothetical protein ACOCXA_00010 [Planctomycetota bacterium]